MPEKEEAVNIYLGFIGCHCYMSVDAATAEEIHVKGDNECERERYFH